MSYRDDRAVLHARLWLARGELSALDDQRGTLRRKRAALADEIFVLEQHLAQSALAVMTPRDMPLTRLPPGHPFTLERARARAGASAPTTAEQMRAAVEEAMLRRIRILTFVAAYGPTLGFATLLIAAILAAMVVLGGFGGF